MLYCFILTSCCADKITKYFKEKNSKSNQFYNCFQNQKCSFKFTKFFLKIHFFKLYSKKRILNFLSLVVLLI